MKIGEATNQFPDFPHQKKVKEKEKAGASSGKRVNAEGKAEFSEAFLDAAAQSVQASLDELLRGVQDQGERLARHQNFGEMDRYKTLVRGFLRKVIDDLYKLQPSDGGNPRPGQKVYVILQKVDAELDKLAKMVLAGQVPQLRILEKLDQIKGLLLDSYK